MYFLLNMYSFCNFFTAEKIRPEFLIRLVISSHESIDRHYTAVYNEARTTIQLCNAF